MHHLVRRTSLLQVSRPDLGLSTRTLPLETKVLQSDRFKRVPDYLDGPQTESDLEFYEGPVVEEPRSREGRCDDIPRVPKVGFGNGNDSIKSKGSK